jgi:hypothetical protein
MKTCKHCGMQITEDSKFCTYCGTAYDENNGANAFSQNDFDNGAPVVNVEGNFSGGSYYNSALTPSLEQFFKGYISNRTIGYHTTAAIICIFTAIISFILLFEGDYYSLIDIIFYLTFGILLLKKKDWVIPLIVICYSGIMTVFTLIVTGTVYGAFALAVGIRATIGTKKANDAYKDYLVKCQINLRNALSQSLTNASNPNAFEFDGNYYDINIYARIRADIFKGFKEKQLQKMIKKCEKNISAGKDVDLNRAEIETLKVALTRNNDDKYKFDATDTKKYINSLASTESEQKTALLKIFPDYYDCESIEQLIMGDKFFEVKSKINQTSLEDSVCAYKQIQSEMKSYDESNRKGAKIIAGLLLKQIKTLNENVGIK